MEDLAGDLNLTLEDNAQIQQIVQRVVDSNGGEAATLFPRFSQVITHYQEQPQLLDPLLEALVSPLSAVVLSFTPQQVQVAPGGHDAGAGHRMRATCRLLWQLSAVRGYKTVLRFMPNEVAAFEPAAALLAALSGALLPSGNPGGGADAAPPPPGTIDPAGGSCCDSVEGDGTWEAQYIMLMWLSMLALIPFDLAMVDSSLGGSAAPAVDGGAGYPPLVGRLMGMCRRFLESTGPTREMAAVLTGRLVTRPDMSPALREFAEWGCAAMRGGEAPAAAFLVPGVTLAFATTFKLGQRRALLPLALQVLPAAVELLGSRAGARSSLVRKLAVKLVQRAGLALLPPRVAAWRYQRGQRALGSKAQGNEAGSGEENAGGGASPGGGKAGGAAAQHSTGQQQQEQQEEEEEEDGWMGDPAHAEGVESAIEALLVGLADRDTVVRWSAAKGLGRLTGRLPRSLGDEVVASVVASFSAPAAGDAAWHGGCLALAELARRGLLLPGRLPEVVPLVVRALEFDVRRGPCSVGAHVRDAGAFVCWAFARAYSPSALGAAVGSLAPALITAACCDREVNCRRAAAAAFQECVGRLGSFPHGIDILTAADYFTVSVRSAAYVTVAPHVASFPGYFRPLAWHLLSVKLVHWEKALRELAARALAALVPLDPAFFVEEALPYVLPLCTSPSLEARHGAAAAAAELMLALRASGAELPAALLAAVADVVPGVYRAKLNRGKGGEVLRSALCRLIETTAAAAVPLSAEQQACLHAAALDNLRHLTPDIQQAAAAALAAFAQQYLCGSGGAAGGAERRQALVEQLLSELTDSGSVTARRGAALALGVLPRQLLEPPQWRIMSALAEAARLDEDPGARDAETRVNAVEALSRAALTLHSAGPPPAPEANARQGAALDNLERFVLEPLALALQDYSTDSRGDVGSWVREAAMGGAVDVLCMLGPGGAAQVPAAARRVLLALLRQAVERIARVRERSGRELQRLAPLVAAAGAIPGASEVAAAVGGVSAEGFGDLAALPELAALVRCPPVQAALLEGLVFSIGGLDAQLAEAAVEAVAEAMRPLRLDELERVGEVLLTIWAQHGRSPRMATPLLVTADVLLARTELQALLSCPAGGNTFASRLLAAVNAEVAGCTDVPRLHAASAVLCQLAGGATGAVRGEALCAALSLLGNRFPKVRRYAAEQLYTTLLAWDPADEGDGWEAAGCDADAAMELLSETAWDGPAEVVRPARLAVCASLGVAAPPPAPGGDAGCELRKVQRDENASYGALLAHQRRGL